MSKRVPKSGQGAQYAYQDPPKRSSERYIVPIPDTGKRAFQPKTGPNPECPRPSPPLGWKRSNS